MTREEFDDLLDGLGPDLGRWPDGARRAALDLLDRDPDTARALETALLLDAALAAPPPAAHEALRRAVLDIPLAHPRGVRRTGVLDRLLAGAATGWRAWSAGAVAACAAMLMGFYLGYGGLVALPGLTGAGDGTQAATPEEELVALVAALEPEVQP